MHIISAGGILIFEFDLNMLAKFSANSSASESTKRLINESNHDIVSYPLVKEDQLNDKQEMPIGINLTEFHVAIFYKYQVKILCLLNKELVYNQKFDIKVSIQLKFIWIV